MKKYKAVYIGVAETGVRIDFYYSDVGSDDAQNTADEYLRLFNEPDPYEYWKLLSVEEMI